MTIDYQKYVDQLNRRLNLQNEVRRGQLIAGALLVATAIVPLLKKPKEGRRRRIDPVTVFGLLGLGSMLFGDANSDPHLALYQQCRKERNPELVCRAQYVTSNIQSYIPDFEVPGIDT